MTGQIREFMSGIYLDNTGGPPAVSEPLHILLKEPFITDVMRWSFMNAGVTGGIPL